MEQTRYLLTCSCGKSVAVDAGLAGAQVRCDCGNSLDVPTLRDLRKLPRETPPPETKPDVAPVADDAPRSTLGCAFTTCLAITVIAATASLFMWVARFGIDTTETVESNLEEGAKAIDNLTVDQTFVLWSLYERDGLLGEQTPEFIFNLQRASMFATAGWITLALAVSSMIAAFVIGWMSAKQQRAR